jgi:hypothetical protein
MIHFHGGPVTPNEAAVQLWTRRHALVSFKEQRQTALALEIAQSVMFDNSAYALWTTGEKVDVLAVADWSIQHERHPAHAGTIIPDDIDGSAFDNDKMIARWLSTHAESGIPVWHMNEDVERLRYLVRCSQGRVYPAVALGSSGQWATPGTDAWWSRMAEAMEVACDEQGRPLCKLHGLRMLSPSIFAHLPLASADSCNVARNIGIDKKWTGSYAPMTSAQRALVMAERIELAPAAATWSRPTQQTFGLVSQ